MTSRKSSNADPEWIAITRQKVESLRFGVVQLVIHEGRVVQIERTEKTRLQSGGADATNDSEAPSNEQGGRDAKSAS